MLQHEYSYPGHRFITMLGIQSNIYIQSTTLATPDSNASIPQDVIVVVAIAPEVARSQQIDVLQLRGAASHQLQSVYEEQ
jgi:hypothetical protein